MAGAQQRKFWPGYQFSGYLLAIPEVLRHWLLPPLRLYRRQTISTETAAVLTPSLLCSEYLVSNRNMFLKQCYVTIK